MGSDGNDKRVASAEEPPSVLDRLKRLAAQPPAKPPSPDQTWQAIPANVDDDETSAAESEAHANVYDEEEDDSWSETPTIQLQRRRPGETSSGIQEEGSAEDMRRAIEAMRAKRRRNRDGE